MELIWDKIKSNEEYLLLGLGVFIIFYTDWYQVTWQVLGFLFIGYSLYLYTKKKIWVKEDGH